MTHCCLCFPLMCGIQTSAILSYVGVVFYIVWIIIIVAVADFVSDFRPAEDDTTTVVTLANGTDVSGDEV